MRTTTALVALCVSLTTLLGARDVLAQNGKAGAPKQSAWPAAALPANYRQLIAEYIRTRNRYVVRDAKISKPYERWGGLLRGGTFTAVCIAVFRDNPFGIVVRDNWVVRFEDRQIKPVAMGMESCSDLSPFPELIKALARPLK
jgi:hypothetical protein